MKRILFCLLSIILVLCLSACEKEKECEHEYESETISEATYFASGETKKTCIYCNDEITETVPKLETPITLTVTDSATIRQEQDPLVLPDGTEMWRPDIIMVILDMEVKNTSDNDVSDFSGTLTIKHDDDTLDLLCTFDEGFDAGETVRLSDYGFEVEYHDLTMADNFIAGVDFEELTFEFKLSEVNFR